MFCKKATDSNTSNGTRLLLLINVFMYRLVTPITKLLNRLYR